MRAPRGFVLVNALIIVAALSVVSVWLLSRAETGRARAAAAQQAVQLELYLDAYEHLAITVLDRDLPVVDHLSEDWARADLELELDLLLEIDLRRVHAGRRRDGLERRVVGAGAELARGGDVEVRRHHLGEAAHDGDG